ncbi:unnamed protein product [Effrenium voratum]|nr:unnamed protein product [Effrenium voratum]
MGVDAPVPSRAMVLCADWCNIFAGISLVISFLIITGAFTFNWFEMQGGWHTAMQVTMTLEGILWAIAAALLARINVVVNNAAVAVGQVIICFGGIFFTISGLQEGTWQSTERAFGPLKLRGFPPCFPGIKYHAAQKYSKDGVPGKVISLSYVLAPAAQQKKCLDPTSWAPSMSAAFADACPYYGISCFMMPRPWGSMAFRDCPRRSLAPSGLSPASSRAHGPSDSSGFGGPPSWKASSGMKTWRTPPSTCTRTRPSRGPGCT